MSDNNEENFTVPSDPDVRQRIRNAVNEAYAVKVQQKALRDQYKAIVEIAKELEVPKSIFNKMVKVYADQNYSDVVHDDEVFHSFFETIMENKLVSPGIGVNVNA